jgi:hypothetical protein
MYPVTLGGRNYFHSATRMEVYSPETAESFVVSIRKPPEP